jgi:hypothetical protein
MDGGWLGKRSEGWIFVLSFCLKFWDKCCVVFRASRVYFLRNSGICMVFDVQPQKKIHGIPLYGFRRIAS